MKHIVYISLIFVLFGLICSVSVLGESHGIPFSGNHTFDQLQVMNADISDRPDYLADYQNAINQTPSSLNSALYLGKASLKAGNLTEAEREFSYAIEMDKNSQEAWDGLMVALSLDENYELLQKVATDRIALSPLDEKAWLNKGWAQLEQNDGTALESFNRLKAIDPRNVFAYYYSAWTFDGVGQRQNAIKEYKKVSLLSPDYGGVDGNLGFLYTSEEQFEEALPYLDKALVWYPGWTEALRSKAIVLYHLDHQDEAMKTLDHALALDPTFTRAYATKSDAQFDMGMYQDVVNTTDKGLISDPNSTPLLNFKGRALIKLGQNEDAISAFDRVIEINQTKSDWDTQINTAESWWGKGAALDNLGRSDEAKDAYTQGLTVVEGMIQEFPDSGFLYHFKDLILTGLGKTGEAQVARVKADELAKGPDYYKTSYI